MRLNARNLARTGSFRRSTTYALENVGAASETRRSGPHRRLLSTEALGDPKSASTNVPPGGRLR